ncbi:MAG: hypothetical protein BV456_00990 [Thermoplasmata archaeon M8B2D]|nr:MAG: hypothetical protein BV456_00990 [Thermoplasmata archaeon M8B2D]
MNLNVDYLFRIIDQMTPVVKRMASNFSMHVKNMGKSLTDLGKKFKWFSAGAGVVVWKTLKESMNFEEAEKMFGAFIDSTKKGKQLATDIDNLSKKIFIKNKVLRESTQMMLAYGISSDKIIPLMTMLGKISVGNSEKFKVLAYNLSQIKSLGKLTAIDLKSLTLAGFNPLQIISDKTGRSMTDLKEIMSEGGISFAMVVKAMRDATSEGGRFSNVLEEIRKSLKGELNVFLSTFDQVLRSIGDELKPFFKSLLIKLTAVLEIFKASPQWIKKLIAILLVLTAVLSPLLILLGSLATVIGFISLPVLAIGTAITGVIGILLYWKEIILGLDRFLRFLWKDLKIIGEWIKDVFSGIIDSIVNKFKELGYFVEKLKFWKKDIANEELLEVNKNINTIGGTNRFDIQNLLKIENKNDSKLEYTPIPSEGAGQSMMY